MTEVAQKRAVTAYRSRLSARGLKRFEVQAPEADRDLIRSLARKLADDGPEATQIRMTMQRAIAGDAPRKGGILAALLQSPLVGSNIEFQRERGEGRKIDL